MEEWKTINGFEGCYEVSNKGQIRSLDRWVANTASSSRFLKGQIIKPFIQANGYADVKLAAKGKKTTHYIHRLVATAFHGPGKPNDDAMHLDGNKINNIPQNLAWGTRKENVADGIRRGVWAHGERHGHAKLTEQQIILIRADTRLHREIATNYGVSRTLISMIKRRSIWVHVG